MNPHATYGSCLRPVPLSVRGDAAPAGRMEGLTTPLDINTENSPLDSRLKALPEQSASICVYLRIEIAAASCAATRAINSYALAHTRRVPGIFGLYHRDGRPVDADTLASMRRRMHGAAAAGGGQSSVHGMCGLGEIGGPLDRAPRTEGHWRPPGHLAIAASARLDAHAELCDVLEIPTSDRHTIADADLVRRAYVRWGEAALSRLLGDWCLAVWHVDTQRLLVARDQLGASTIYTFVDDRHVAFASNLAALLALPAATTHLDEAHLARVLTSWPSPETTCYADIRRLPLGHCLTATATASECRRYFEFAPVEALRLARDEEYVEACGEIFARAVADRLRGSRSAAVALSGGLDSGAVAMTASRLRPSAAPLAAIAHVPHFAHVELAGQIANEAPYVAATARAAGLTPVTYLDSARVTPIEGLRRAMGILAAPSHAAANQFWLLDMLATARELGYDTLLTGQLGNLTFSWGGVSSRDWRTLWRAGHRRSALVAALPGDLNARVRALRRWWRGAEPWRDYSAIHPAFAQRLRLAERMAEEAHDPVFDRAAESPLASRLRMLRAPKGEFAEAGVAHGVTVADPTADLRLVRFCLSLPDAQFVGPRGETRWLVRRLMSDRLPPEVLWNARRGRQASDLTLRFTACARDVEAALAACDASARATEYLDVPYLRQTWRSIQGRADTGAQRRAVAILSRGLMTGLFLAEVAGPESS